ncbi:anthranilate synthase component I family protein [Psychrobacter alimentarius]|uniref:anthranilate synthase component I family protein n=1 Tax=Psychrobacter alimentarius TaxID=261164 RepID=UPI003FD5CC51
MPVENYKTTEQTDSAPSPATIRSWRFGDLPAAELMPQLQNYLLAQNSEALWQLVWLNNDDQPVIGLLPKTSWVVTPTFGSLSDPLSVTYEVTKHCRDACINIDDNAADRTAITTTQMSYAKWQDELIAYSQVYEDHSTDITPSSTINKKPNYHHGLIGFIGYDISAHELSPTAAIQLAAQPSAVLGHYDIYLMPATQDSASVWTLTVNQTENTFDTKDEHHHKNTLISVLTSYLDAFDKTLSDATYHLEQATSKTPLPPAPLALKAQWDEHDYQLAFAQTQDYLQQGDCYQINLTQAWQGSLTYHALSDTSLPTLINYLPSLHRNTQAPFAGYLSVQYGDITHAEKDLNNALPNSINQKNTFELLSCSPELFFTFTKDYETGTHHIRTKPIKGTMPRGTTPEQDNAYKQQLVNSEKDRAENVMIVDLLRNDLGKYAKIGSVKVPQLFAIESFSNVHHMVSTITAELKADTHPLAVLFGSLPAGSITGTPKKRSVEIISELEVAPRGAYCGTIGYMNFDGSGQWNVLIRTIQANHSFTNGIQQQGQVSLWAGGGITVASDCVAEYQECLDKVGNLLAVLAQK